MPLTPGRAAKGVIVAACVLAGACGGPSFSAGGNDGGGDARADGATGDDGAITSDGGNQNDGSGDDGSGDGPGTNDGPAAACPTVGGLYAMTLVQGQGCGDLNALAAECIVQTTCTIQFRATAAAGSPGIDGDPTLQADGSFMGGMLKVGTTTRSGCTGTWDGSTSTMTVDCGGVDSGQSCEVALKRTAGTCP